jgi:hypothetical protein
VPDHLRAVGRSGIEVDARPAVVFSLRNGRILDMRLYRQTAEAMKAVGLEDKDLLSPHQSRLVRGPMAFRR